MRTRPIKLPEDLEAVGALLDRVEAADGHHPIGEHKYLVLMQGDPGKVVGLVVEVADSMAAYVALTPSLDPGWWGMEMAVDPDHRAPDVYEGLFTAAIEEVGRRYGNAIRAWLFQPRLAEAAVRLGFQPERELFKLERQLPGGFGPDRPEAKLPEGIQLAAFGPGDVGAWLRVNNESFAGHPENGRWTREILADRMSQSWFRPRDLIMAWAGSDLAGFCWVKQASGQGEIYIVAVAPRYQGKGLGRALVVRGLGLMEAEGDRVAYLYVDAVNHRALRLYRSLGFYVDHVDRSFVRVLS